MTSKSVTLTINHSPFIKSDDYRRILGTNQDQSRIEMVEFKNPTRTFIICTCKTFQLREWCEHVNTWYTDNLDAEKNCDVQRRIGYKPIITIFVKPLLLAQTVVVPLRDDESHGIHSVHCVWGSVSDSSDGSVASSGGDGLGFIDPQREGRGAIRKLFLEWIPSQFYADRTCQSTWHDGPATLAEEARYVDGFDEATLEVAEQARRMLICNTYSILNTGICYKCLEITPF